MTNNNQTKEQRIELYKHDSEWCYALWVDGEYDHSDGLGVSESEGFAAAEDALRDQLGLPADLTWQASSEPGTLVLVTTCAAS